MTEINRERLLSVVNGDWTPYSSMQTFDIVLPPPNENRTESREYIYTDFNLLRHDIHVLLHHSVLPRNQKGESE